MAGSEDFSYVLREVPGAFIGLGACMPGADPAAAPMNHSPRAQFDDAVLADAAAIYAGLAARRLDKAVRQRCGGGGKRRTMTEIATESGREHRPQADRAVGEARAIVGVGTGNGIEYFDWTVYAIFAAFFAPQFFHTGSAVSDLLATFGVFAVGFVARPFGGLLFGWIVGSAGPQAVDDAGGRTGGGGQPGHRLTPTYRTIGSRRR